MSIKESTFRYRVLVVEDEATQAIKLSAVLSAAGYDVDVAADGAEGLALTRTRHPDAIISDIEMPEMDGYDLCRGIRADATLRHIAVILLTSHSAPDDVIKGLEAGADTFFAKPYDTADLLQTVSTLVRRRTGGAETEDRVLPVTFRDCQYNVRSSRTQILNFFLEVYRETLKRHEELQGAHQKLEFYSGNLAQLVAERTSELRQENEIRRQAEQESRVHATMLSSTFEATHDGILVLDLHRSIITANRQFYELWKIPEALRSASEAENFFEYASTQLSDAQSFREDQEYLQNHPEIESSGTIGFSDGRVFASHSHPQILDGKVVGRVWSFRDVTAERSAERALRESEERHRSLFERMQDGAYRCTPDGRLTDANPALWKMLGIGSREELLAIDSMQSLFVSDAEWHSFVHPNSPARCAMFRLRRRDGSEIWVEEHGLHEFDQNGAVVYLEGILRDVTQTKHTEEHLRFAKQAAEDAARAKSEFMATMSHELRTPMNGVLGMVALLADTPLSTEQHECVEVIRTSGEALLSMIRDVLDFSSIDAGKVCVNPAPFDVITLIEKVVHERGATALQKKLKVQVHSDPALPPTILGDQALLQQVLEKLLDNAIKFTQAGEVMVGAEVQRQESGPPHLRLRVRDSGIGIPREKLGKLFTAFSQVDGSASRRYGGTGLGLAISKRLIELMGGSISVESEPGKGSTFTVLVPLDEWALVQPNPAAKEESLRGKRVLVVGGDPSVVDLLSSWCKRAGLRVLSCRSGAEGMAALAMGQEFAVTVVDEVMPDMNGLAFARQVVNEMRERVPRLLLLTPHSGSGVLEDILAAAAVCVTKPLKERAVLDAIAQALPCTPQHGRGSPSPVAVASGLPIG